MALPAAVHAHTERYWFATKKKVKSEICKQCFIGERLHRASRKLSRSSSVAPAWLLSSPLPLHFVSQTVLPGLTVIGMVLQARQLT